MISNFKCSLRDVLRSKQIVNLRGFTLIEILVSIAIFSFLILITVGVLTTVLFNSNQQFTSLGNVDNALLVTNNFVNQIRNATTGADGSYALNTASNNQIIFYSQSASGATINRIDYYLSGTTLYEGIVVPTGNPVTYNLASESKIIVQSNVVNQSNNPIFTYYDGNYNGATSPFSEPVNVNLVKFVNINLTVLNDVTAGSTAQFSISTGAAMRNLKNNLGD